jgi:hypothetical protein
VVQWSEFLAEGPEVLSSIPGVTRFLQKYWVWYGVLVSTIEKLLGRKETAV